MAFYSRGDLLASTTVTASGAQTRMRELQEPSAQRQYDIFLSHSYLDAALVWALREELQRAGASVYVDWIDDPTMDRSTVNAATAEKLKKRMNNCRALVYATSRASKRSRWMPWELGYFDGRRSAEKVSICPITIEGTGPYEREEYLQLYRLLERRRIGYGYGPVLTFNGIEQRIPAFIR